ncbi:MAG: oxygenase MpaB family protein [Vicinamibacteraceae bacterium]
MARERLDVSLRVNREMLVILGWGRAILLQFAHPLVAAGVAEHSDFSRARAGRTRRLMHTVQSFLALTFGELDERHAAAARINAIHLRVHGTLKRSAGRFAAGTPYSAEDPELLRWVHCTLVDSVMRVYELVVEPLSVADKDRLAASAATIEPLLRIPDGFLPRDLRTLDAYLERMQSSGEVVVTDTARLLARDLLEPPLAWMVRPAFQVLRLLTIGLLPPAVRAGYGYAWTDKDERALARRVWMLRGLRRILPRAAWEWPAARRSRAAGPHGAREGCRSHAGVSKDHSPHVARNT